MKNGLARCTLNIEYRYAAPILMVLPASVAERIWRPLVREVAGARATDLDARTLLELQESGLQGQGCAE
ncbi:hypothetical protein ACNQQN_24920 [Mycobacteroides chelonae]|uniref:hypothetical protein n=1 Tax=Mycobacteroides chelonae TaxID=1774 RepID=UPI003AAF8746